MGKSASDVRHDIDMARRDMSYTIDEIADRASPRRVMDRRRRRMGDRLHTMRTAVMGEPDGYGPERGGTMGNAQDSVGQAQQSAQEKVGQAQETAQGAMQSAQQQAGAMADQMREAPEALTRKTQGNPLAAGLIAFGGGLLAASVFPPSRMERQAAAKLQQQAGPVKEELRRAGQEVAGELKTSAQESAEQVKAASSDAATTVQESAKSSAESVKGDAKDQSGG